MMKKRSVKRPWLSVLKSQGRTGWKMSTRGRLYNKFRDAVYCVAACSRCCSSPCRACNTANSSSLQHELPNLVNMECVWIGQADRRRGLVQCEAADLELHVARNEFLPPPFEPRERLSGLFLVGFAPPVDALDDLLRLGRLVLDALDGVLEGKVLDAPLVGAELLEEGPVHGAESLVFELGERTLVRAFPRVYVVEVVLARERHRIAGRVETLFAGSEGPFALDAGEFLGEEGRGPGGGGRERSRRRQVGQIGRCLRGSLWEEGPQFDRDLRVEHRTEFCARRPGVSGMLR